MTVLREIFHILWVQARMPSHASLLWVFHVSAVHENKSRSIVSRILLQKSPSQDLLVESVQRVKIMNLASQLVLHEVEKGHLADISPLLIASDVVADRPSFEPEAHHSDVLDTVQPWCPGKLTVS